MTSFSSCRLIPPSSSAWKQALSIHIGLLVGVVLPLSILLYKLPQRIQRPVAIGLGILAGVAPPLSVAFDVFDQGNEGPPIHPWMAFFLWATFGFSCCFRCMTVALQTYPEGADSSLQTWIFWFTSFPEPLLVKGNLVRIRQGELLSHFSLMLIKVAAMTIQLSVYLNYSITPVQDEVMGADDDASWIGVRSVAFLVDAWFHLWWIYVFASFCLDVGSFLVKLAGVTTESSFSNPLLTSRCYREVWNLKWNHPVHLLLKRTVYIPMRQSGFDGNLATLSSFVMSGLLHEYNFYVHNQAGYEAFHAMAFFVFVGLAMMIENLFHRKVLVHYKLFACRVPTFCVSILLTSAVLPAFDRLFFKSWMEAGMLDSLRELMPTVECS